MIAIYFRASANSDVVASPQGARAFVAEQNNKCTPLLSPQKNPNKFSTLPIIPNKKFNLHGLAFRTLHTVLVEILVK